MAVLAIFIFLYQRVFAITFDEPFARATGTRVPEPIKQLPRLPVRHTQVCQKDDMEAALLRVLP